VAKRAVHGIGLFAGVRYLVAKDLRADLRASTERGAKRHHEERVPPALLAARSAVCIVAWQGHFAPSTVLAGWSPHQRSGSLAIVVVRQRDDHVLVTMVLEHAPLGLSRVFPHPLETPLLR
jgi:hypothetical protein